MFAPPQSQTGGPTLVSHPWLLVQHKRFCTATCHSEVKIYQICLWYNRIHSEQLSWLVTGLHFVCLLVWLFSLNAQKVKLSLQNTKCTTISLKLPVYFGFGYQFVSQEQGQHVITNIWKEFQFTPCTHSSTYL